MLDIYAERKQAYQRRRRHARIDIRNPELRRAVFSRDGSACVKCGSKDNLVISHVISVYCVGETTENNLQTLCKPCNFAKPL